jgi:hypothetical protein
MSDSQCLLVCSGRILCYLQSTIYLLWTDILEICYREFSENLFGKFKFCFNMRRITVTLQGFPFRLLCSSHWINFILMKFQTNQLGNINTNISYSVTYYKRLRCSRGSVLAFSTQVRGLKPGRSGRIRARRNPQDAFLRRRSNAVDHMSYICGM